MEGITEAQVIEAHDAAVRCVDAYAAYIEALRETSRRYRVDCDGPTVVEPSEEQLAALDELVSEMRSCVSAAKRPVGVVEWHLAAVTRTVVESGPVKAASWMELCIRLVEWTLQFCRPWSSFYESEQQRRWDRHSFPKQHAVEPEGLKAALKQEAARMRDRAVALGADVRYGYVLQRLKPTSRRMFEYFLQREGRLVLHEDISDYLWPGEEGVPENRIHQAVWQLRTELQELQVPHLAADLVTEKGDGGYRFR